MTNEQIILELRKIAKSSPAAEALFTMWASRARTPRNGRIDFNALIYQMKHEGFNYGREEYIKIFKMLEKLGLCKISVTYSGKVLGLTDIKVKITSIGAAALGQKGNFEFYKIKMKYQKLPIMQKEKNIETTKVIAKSNSTEINTVIDSSNQFNKISVLVDGLELKIEVPEGLSAIQLLNIINKLK